MLLVYNKVRLEDWLRTLLTNDQKKVRIKVKVNCFIKLVLGEGKLALLSANAD